MKVIVAKYEENTAWAERYDSFVVEKGVHIKNVGREPASFLWYILEHYDELEGNYVFLQGNPYDHCPELDTEIGSTVTEFKHLGTKLLHSKYNGHPHDNGFHMGEPMNIMGLTPLDSYPFVAGGQFITTAEQLKKYTKQQYKDLLLYCVERPKNCYALERIWETLYTDQKT